MGTFTVGDTNFNFHYRSSETELFTLEEMAKEFSATLAGKPVALSPAITYLLVKGVAQVAMKYETLARSLYPTPDGSHSMLDTLKWAEDNMGASHSVTVDTVVPAEYEVEVKKFLESLPG